MPSRFVWPVSWAWIAWPRLKLGDVARAGDEPRVIGVMAIGGRRDGVGGSMTVAKD